MHRSRAALTTIAAATLAVAGLTACSSDSSDTTPSTSPSTSTTPPTTPPTSPPTTPPPTTTPRTTIPATTTPPKPDPVPTTDGGGSAQAGAPSFTSFEVSSAVPCEGGNATVEMSFATVNVVEIEIKIGDGSFASTAGYGPNERDVVASIPCTGAGTSSIQLRGCTEDHECAESPKRSVEITA